MILRSLGDLRVETSSGFKGSADEGSLLVGGVGSELLTKGLEEVGDGLGTSSTDTSRFNLEVFAEDGIDLVESALGNHLNLSLDVLGDGILVHLEEGKGVNQGKDGGDGTKGSEELLKEFINAASRNEEHVGKTSDDELDEEAKEDRAQGGDTKDTSNEVEGVFKGRLESIDGQSTEDNHDDVNDDAGQEDPLEGAAEEARSLLQALEEDLGDGRVLAANEREQGVHNQFTSTGSGAVARRVGSWNGLATRLGALRLTRTLTGTRAASMALTVARGGGASKVANLVQVNVGALGKGLADTHGSRDAGSILLVELDGSVHGALELEVGVGDGLVTSAEPCLSKTLDEATEAKDAR